MVRGSGRNARFLASPRRVCSWTAVGRIARSPSSVTISATSSCSGSLRPPKFGIDRMTRRNRGDDGPGLQEFYDRDRRELKWGIGSAFTLADGMLVNQRIP